MLNFFIYRDSIICKQIDVNLKIFIQNVDIHLLISLTLYSTPKLLKNMLL